MATNSAARPGLTIRVYKVDSRTLERTGDDHPPVALAPAEEPMLTMAWPPCRCGRCGRRAG